MTEPQQNIHWQEGEISRTDRERLIQQKGATLWFTGLSIQQAIKDLTKACKKNTPQIRVATPYFKPNNNKTDSTPDYYIHETDDWLVFPHELHGLNTDEIRQYKPELAQLIEKMAPIIAKK